MIPLNAIMNVLYDDYYDHTIINGE